VPLEFAPDGSLFAGGTDRGWGSRGGKRFSLERLVWTGKTPFEVHEMRAEADGFTVTFTKAVDPASVAADAFRIRTYTYIYQANYGSPEVDPTTPAISGVELAGDRKSVRLRIDALARGHIHELELPGLRSADGEPLLHPVAYYTLNRIPR
jgi:hypothetical protein